MKQRSLFDARQSAAIGAAPSAGIEIGRRVRVRIGIRSRYAVGAAEALDGITGTVEAHDPRSTNGDPWLSSAYLVRFDATAPTWHAHQLPAGAFWFPPDDMELL